MTFFYEPSDGGDYAEDAPGLDHLDDDRYLDDDAPEGSSFLLDGDGCSAGYDPSRPVPAPVPPRNDNVPTGDPIWLTMLREKGLL